LHKLKTQPTPKNEKKLGKLVAYGNLHTDNINTDTHVSVTVTVPVCVCVYLCVL